MSERQANRRKTFFKLKLVLLLSSPKQFSVKGPVGFILHLVFVLFFLLVLPQGVRYVKALQRYLLQV